MTKKANKQTPQFVATELSEIPEEPKKKPKAPRKDAHTAADSHSEAPKREKRKRTEEDLESEAPKKAKTTLENMFQQTAEGLFQTCVLLLPTNKKQFLEKASRLFLFFKNNSDFFPERSSRSFNFERSLRARPRESSFFLLFLFFFSFFFLFL